ITTQGQPFTNYPPPATDSQRWHVSGDGYAAINEIGGVNPYWIPTIALAPGFYRGTWSVSRAGESAGGADILGIECRFHPILNNNDFQTHELMDFRNWECFPNYPHTPPIYDTGAVLQFGKGNYPWPSGGEYTWLSGRTSSWYENSVDPLILKNSYDHSPGNDLLYSGQFSRWKCPGRIWININLTNYDSTFTLTGDSTSPA
ncbi:MAG TPA: hypothetical protein VHL11_11410, partial [Phototrophicaceae bacterium]|nr:hypothetical protein [Phototrophicaceae bacterium]